MKNLTLILVSTILFFACNNTGKESAKLPAGPASAEAVMQLLKGQKYTSDKIALISPFSMDKESPYQWLDEKFDTSKFFRDYLDERLQFSLQFSNNTAVTVNDRGKTVNGTYSVDNITGEKEKEGIKLRISFADASMSFPGAIEPMIVTYTYPVAGADKNNLLLETPTGYNNRYVAVLMRPGK